MKRRVALFGILLFAITHSGFASTPITDLGTGLYLNQFQGGLYENGLNTVPADHNTAGLAALAEIQPLDANGNPSANGKIGLMSIGMSNAIQKWCATLNAQNPNLPCNSWSFTGQALADNTVNSQSLVIVPGGLGSQVIDTWDEPTDPNWDRVATQVLPRFGVTENQIQVIWLMDANPRPTVSLPDSNADAYAIETGYANIIRIAKQRYPNLKMVFVSSRAYAGYATTTLNPEPYAYESGFAVKWLVQAQIDQMRNGGTVVDPLAGDLNYNTGSAPWIAWGPYFWADGTNPRSDGFTWRLQDVDPADGTHPSPACPSSCGTGSTNSGEYKAGLLLLQFFKTSPYTSSWFLAQTGDTTPPQATITSPTQNQVLAYGTTQWALTVTTNEPATCKHHNTDVTYASMSNTFNAGALLTSFSDTLVNLQNGQTRNKFVRCQDAAGNAMTSSASVTFSISSAPPTKTGDLNNDGIVNIVDVQRVVSKLGTAATTGEDINGDGTVNLFDLIVLAQNWG